MCRVGCEKYMTCQTYAMCFSVLQLPLFPFLRDDLVSETGSGRLSKYVKKV